MFYVFIITVDIIWSVSFALVEGYEWKEQYLTSDYLLRRRYNSLWHKFQISQRFFGNLLGFLFGYFYLADHLSLFIRPWRIITSYLLIITIHWIISDSIQNIIKDRSIFFISTQTTAITESYSQWYVKLFLLVLFISFQFL